MSEDASAQVQTSDPLKTVADAMEHAVQAAGRRDRRQGEGRSGIPGREPIRVPVRIHDVLHDLLRSRVPFGARGTAIPKDNPIVHGLVDGAHAAVDMVDEMRKRKTRFACRSIPRPRSATPERDSPVRNRPLGFRIARLGRFSAHSVC